MKLYRQISRWVLSGSLASVLCTPVVAQRSDVDQTESAEFDHSAIHVRDLEKSAAFYETILNLKRMPDPFKDGRHIWFHIGPHDQLHVIGGAANVEKQDIDVHLSFRVRSVENFVKKLDRANVIYVNSKNEEGKITVRPDGVKQVYLQDPDGYWLEVNDAKLHPPSSSLAK